MKSKITFLLLCSALICIGQATFAQVTGTSNDPLAPTTMSTNYIPPSGFLGQAASMFMQTDRGLGTWTTTNGQPKTLDVYVGSCFENNINADAIIGGDYRIYKGLVADFSARIFNANQTLKSIAIGPGIEIPINDLKIGLYLDGVYRNDDHCLAVEPKIALKPGIGKNAYLIAALATDFEIKSRGGAQRPYVTTGFGFNY